ncbi:hypothetical protein HQN87_01470 [Paenibacillus tritici]|uniref:Uncharacterized protein n=1 Tax=Paenibacillus tritici TaxID=1873425 RepID=A0ABX2DHJ5_9BACL|nr:hypothetical protein [Paenibacillus tritici]NQX43985.1 hypothetical protein [Paenibacillus tritici]
MNFDFGGFTGGIIGTIGAFGAAWYTLKKQERSKRPAVYAKTIAESRFLFNLLRGFEWDITLATKRVESIEEDPRLNLLEVKYLVRDHLKVLEEHIPKAIETDLRIASSLMDYVSELDDLNYKYRKDDSVEETNSYKSEHESISTKTRQKLFNIRSEVENKVRKIT